MRGWRTSGVSLLRITPFRCLIPCQSNSLLPSVNDVKCGRNRGMFPGNGNGAKDAIKMHCEPNLGRARSLNS